MNIFNRTAGLTGPRSGRQILVSLLSLTLLVATMPQDLVAARDIQAPAVVPDAPTGTQATPTPSPAAQTAEQLQQLVAPIALYPDSLVSQILAASTFPEQVVEADRWLQAHPELKGDVLGQAVDQQSWDPSVKALTAFPTVLGNMDKNLSWMSSLGDAYYNQEQDVMDAVQVMRKRAQASGNLKTTAQQDVTTQDSTVVVEPANSEEVYIPAYDPWIVYGDPIAAWPGWYPYPGIWYDGPYLGLGVGFGIGWFGGYGWGWHHWGCNWHDRVVIHDRERYYSRSQTFYSRSNYYRGEGARGGFNDGRGGANASHSGVNGERGGARDHAEPGNRSSNGDNRGGGEAFNRPEATAKPFEGNRAAARGYSEPRGQSGTRSGAFSGYDHGGQERSFSSRGGASFGGGGFHGGGGGSGRH